LRGLRSAGGPPAVPPAAGRRSGHFALLKESQRGDRVVILHLTLGERGNPALAPDAYAEQKRREAAAAAAALGAEVMFGPHHDGEIPDSDDARR